MTAAGAPPALVALVDPRRADSRKVLWALARKGLAVEVVAVDRPADVSRAAAICARAEGEPPPILVDGATVVAGSTAVAFHLESRYHDPSLFPADPRRRNQAVTMNEFADEALAPLLEAPPGGASAAALVDRLERVREAIARGALDGPEPHLGDLAVGAALAAAEAARPAALGAHPDLAAYARRIAARCGAPQDPA